MSSDVTNEIATTVPSADTITVPKDRLATLDLGLSIVVKAALLVGLAAAFNYANNNPDVLITTKHLNLKSDHTINYRPFVGRDSKTKVDVKTAVLHIHQTATRDAGGRWEADVMCQIEMTNRDNEMHTTSVSARLLDKNGYLIADFGNENAITRPKANGIARFKARVPVDLLQTVEFNDTTLDWDFRQIY